MNTQLKSATARPLSRQVGTFPRSHLVAFLTLLALSTFNPQPSTFAQGTAFTYQGRLTDNGSPATGYYDILFSLYDAASGGSQLDGTLMGTAVPVTNGLFIVTLDFGSGIFTGPARWLKLDVRTNAAGPYTPLSPRQELTATPYAVTAGSLTGVVPAGGVSGAYSNAVTFNNLANQFNGAFSGNGANVSNVNALTLGGLGAGNFWKTGGNGGTTAGANFLGTTDNQPLELKVNGQRALRLEPNSSDAPNVIGGSTRNFVGAGVVGAVIGGGGRANGFVGTNSVLGDFGVVSGGFNNTVGDGGNSIAGGAFNYIGSAGNAAIGGGIENQIADYAQYSVIGCGANNAIGTNSPVSAIGGGVDNLIDHDVEGGMIGGGEENLIGTESHRATIAGGLANLIGNGTEGATIAGGENNSIGTNSFDSAIGGGSANTILAGVEAGTIAGGVRNYVDSPSGTIAGGWNNTIGTNSFASSIGGGDFNLIRDKSWDGEIAGGEENLIGTNAPFSTIGGGQQNSIAANSDHATIGGGYTNYVAAVKATIGGGEFNSIGTNSGWSTIAGGTGNTIAPYSEDSSIGGGFANYITSSRGTIAGGVFNEIDIGTQSTISGGAANTIQSGLSTIAGGYNCNIEMNSSSATIGGGNSQGIGSFSSYSTIAGGYGNQVGDHSAFATIPGGYQNGATNYAFAAGTEALAAHTGAFVWGDSTQAYISSTNANSVTFRASGGYRLFSDTNATAGVFLAPGGTSWASISDRNAKKDFAPVDSRTLLEKLASIPITQWHYKWEDQGTTPHIGPMAQDFKAAFYPGSDDKSITTQEADGVALAAIQGLNVKLTEELKRRDADNAELRQRLERLERLLSR